MQIKIPDLCLPWIKLQRSGYKDHKAEFVKALKFEFEMMKPFLPEKCKSILDIGCGLAGIDIFLSNHFNNPKLYLFDVNYKSKTIIYGFDRGTSFYNSFEATKDLLELNNINNFKLLDASNGLPKIKDIDLIISLLSWGYHYKLSEYLDAVYDLMMPGSRLILDVRAYTDGVNELKKKSFSSIHKIEHFNKAYRVCCIK